MTLILAFAVVVLLPMAVVLTRRSNDDVKTWRRRLDALGAVTESASTRWDAITVTSRRLEPSGTVRVVENRPLPTWPTQHAA